MLYYSLFLISSYTFFNASTCLLIYLLSSSFGKNCESATQIPLQNLTEKNCFQARFSRQKLYCPLAPGKLSIFFLISSRGFLQTTLPFENKIENSYFSDDKASTSNLYADPSPKIQPYHTQEFLKAGSRICIQFYLELKSTHSYQHKDKKVQSIVHGTREYLMCEYFDINNKSILMYLVSLFESHYNLLSGKDKIMSKLVYAKRSKHSRNLSDYNNSSTVAIKQKYLHQGYNNGSSTIQSSACCQFCKSLGNSSLISPCQCNDKYFHQGCFRKWLLKNVTSKKVSLTEQDGYQVMRCEQCHFKIRFKMNTNTKCRNCQEMLKYCEERKLFTVGITLFFLLTIASIAVILLILLNILPMASQSIERSATLIGIGIFVVLMLIVCLFCSIDCLRVQRYQIEKIYDKSSQRQLLNRQYQRNRHKKRKVSVRNME